MKIFSYYSSGKICILHGCVFVLKSKYNLLSSIGCRFIRHCKEYTVAQDREYNKVVEVLIGGNVDHGSPQRVPWCEDEE